MSFAKAQDLLRLAQMASARHLGVGLAEIMDEFGCTHRTAQRMTKALEDCFPGVETRITEERKKLWALRDHDLRNFIAQGLRDTELTALEMSIRRAGRDGAPDEVVTLERLRDRLLATLPKSHARKAESDTEAMLEANGFACRPGPRLRVNPGFLGAISTALKAPFLMNILYKGSRDSEARLRKIEPYGLILGTRKYLVARLPQEDGILRHFRLDRIVQATILPESFTRTGEFSLANHTEKAFGSFHDPEEYGEVIWEFSQRAADTARQFIFHPAQHVREKLDGSIVVSFQAAGHLEMAWHLYMWGEDVRVIAPEALKTLVANFQRNDFPAFP